MRGDSDRGEQRPRVIPQNLQFIAEFAQHQTVQHHASGIYEFYPSMLLIRCYPGRGRAGKNSGRGGSAGYDR